MEEHGGVKIPDGSVPKMAAALVKNLAAGPDMLAGLGSEILVQVFADADPKAKSCMQAVVLKWAKAFCGEDDGAKKPPKPTLKGKVASEASDDSDLESEVSYAITKDTKREKLAKRDEAITGMSWSQNQAFDASLRFGFVVPEDELAGIKYGTDVMRTEFARRLKKLEHPTLVTVLAKNDADEFRDHFVNLMRAYSKEDMVTETMLLTQFMTVTDDLYEGDFKGKVRYMKAILAKYPGRGLPFTDGFDISLVVKGIKSATSGGGVKDEVKAILAKFDALKATVTTQAADIARLSSEIKNLRGELRNAKPGDEPGPSRNAKPCGICGKFGHYARDCPDKDTKADAKAEVKDSKE